jgi:deazaflavin-dependent oxidoreductase (nitroreductase family)
MSESSGPNDWNARIIEEFRANGGRVGGRFEGATMILLHTFGRRSSTERVNPLAYYPDDDRYVVVASKGGAPTNPDWYDNLLAHPRVPVEVGTETFEVDASEVTGEERDLLWKRIVEMMPGFGEYQKRVERVIPLVALTRVS